MIVFGTAVTDSRTYDRCAAPGIRRAAEPDSVVLAHEAAGSLFHNYNVLLDKAAEHDNLDALVLVHQDVEIADTDFSAKVRAALRDPDVAIVGCVGAVGVRSIAWWQGDVTWASMSHRYEEQGGGEFKSLSWEPENTPSWAKTGEVDTIDGIVIVLSPWAVRELRFDESLGELHGYDFDICMQARVARKKVVTADFRAIHHHSLELISNPEAWIDAYIRIAEKWDGELPDTGSDPKQRAMRAEAEAACAQGVGRSHFLRARATKRRLDRTNRELESRRDQLAATRRELEAIKQKLRQRLGSMRRHSGVNEQDAPVEDSEVITRFHELWRRRRVVLQNTFLGIPAWQNPLDAWITQEIVSEVRPDVIVETGTFQGGSAAFWASLLEVANPAGSVISIDIENRRHRRIQELDIVQRRVRFLEGSSTDPAVVREVARHAEGKKVLAILDSDHSADHVLGELTAYAPLISVGSYIIVQDVAIGPCVAIERFLEQNDDFEPDRTRERLMITNCEGGFLRRVR